MLLLRPEIAIEHDGAPGDLVKGMAIYSAARLQSKGPDPSEVVGNGYDKPKLDVPWRAVMSTMSLFEINR